jgi:hypothetical protein
MQNTAKGMDFICRGKIYKAMFLFVVPRPSFIMYVHLLVIYTEAHQNIQLKMNASASVHPPAAKHAR